MKFRRKHYPTGMWSYTVSTDVNTPPFSGQGCYVRIQVKVLFIWITIKKYFILIEDR